MIKKLLESVREYKKASFLAPFFVATESVLEIAIPNFMAVLIDQGISRNDLPTIVRWGLVLVGFALISLVLGLFAGKYAAMAGTGFAKNLRHDVFHSIQGFSFENIDKFSTSSIITRLTTDITNLQNAYIFIIRLGVRAPVVILSALFFSMRINARLSLIFFFTIPVLAITLVTITLKVHPLFIKVFRYYDKLNRIVQENLLGIRVVKSFNREEQETEKFQEVSESIFVTHSSAAKKLSINMPVMQLCLYTSVILLSWFGAKTIIASNNDPALGLSTGQLAGLITYAIQVLMSLMMLSMVFVMIIISRASAERVVEVLEEKSTLTDPDNPIKDLNNGSIRFENVSFAYSRTAEKATLRTINLTIESGQTVGIVGGTGSAKSSLVQLIPRLYDVTDGRILVAGHDVRDYDLKTLRHQVSMVLQKNVLFSGTIKENLRWGNEFATDEEMIEACKLAQAHDFIMEFPDQYDTYIEQGGTNVSGGQRQRLCIARALLKQPKILILDDSTSAIDTKTDKKIQEGFKQYLPDTTKIIIAQRVTSVMHADQIIVMHDGQIENIGNHSQLMEHSEIYRDVYESQSKGGLNNE